MLHTILIASHAASGIAAFAFGCIGLRPQGQRVSSTFRLYIGALWLMVLLLLIVVAIDWMTIGLTSRLIYGALSLFALFIGWQGWQAFESLRRQVPDWKGAYIENVGFTLIALFDGFVIIGALDLGAPVWLVVAIGLLGIVVGRYALSRVRKGVAA